MLLAEIKKKLGRILPQAEEGDERTDFFDVEDVLTSNVFGALRYLDPRYGLGPVLRDLGLAPITSAQVDLWEADDGCEPDVIIDLEHSLVVVEAKLRSPFGLDQLPREALFAHRRARGRPWRLLCITAHCNEPPYRGLSLARGVASWFGAENLLGLPPSEIEERIAWMPWSAVASRLEESARMLAPPSHVVALIEDLLASLRGRALTRLPFHGFARIPTMARGWTASPWRGTPSFLAEPSPQFAGFVAAGGMELHRYRGWFRSG